MAEDDDSVFDRGPKPEIKSLVVPLKSVVQNQDETRAISLIEAISDHAENTHLMVILGLMVLKAYVIAAYERLLL